MRFTKLVPYLFVVLFSAHASADDGAASIAAGGLVSRRETRVVMAKETLLISLKKVVVDYDFRNDSDEDVTTEVAFPVPPYGFSSDEHRISDASFHDFKLLIDGKPAHFLTETKALLNGKDVSALLNAKRIDIATCAHSSLDGEQGYGQNEYPDFSRLPVEDRRGLVKEGLFYDADHGGCKWTVRLNYHWTQTFPAHATVHIRHEYSPVLGSDQLSDVDALLEWKRTGKPLPKGLEAYDTRVVVNAFCPDLPTLQTLSNRLHRLQDLTKATHQDGLDIGWISSADFILTTANTWQQPIEDFTLIIERPKARNSEQSLISFCSPGAVEKLDADHFQVHLTNFVPNAELHIGFFGVPVAKNPKPKPGK